MFGNTPETSIWADNDPEPQSLLERCASLMPFRSSAPGELIDYTVGIEEAKIETETRIRVDVEMSQYTEDENLPYVQYVEDILDPYYWPRHDEFLAEAENYALDQRTVFGGVFGRPTPFSRCTTGTSSRTPSLAPSTTRGGSNYVFVPERPTSRDIQLGPRAIGPRTVASTVVSLEARMSSGSARYCGEDDLFFQNGGLRKNSISSRSSTASLLWPWNWLRSSADESSSAENSKHRHNQSTSENSQSRRSDSFASIKSLENPAARFFGKRSINSAAAVYE